MEGRRDKTSPVTGKESSAGVRRHLKQSSLPEQIRAGITWSQSRTEQRNPFSAVTGVRYVPGFAGRY